MTALGLFPAAILVLIVGVMVGWLVRDRLEPVARSVKNRDRVRTRPNPHAGFPERIDNEHVEYLRAIAYDWDTPIDRDVLVWYADQFDAVIRERDAMELWNDVGLRGERGEAA